jgi:hypothetical protein
MSPEQRQADVDNLYNQVQTERQQYETDAGLREPDPARTADEEPPTAHDSGAADETPGSADAAPVVPKADDEEVQDWRDAEVKDLATAYGLDDVTLAALPNRDVLNHVLQAIDKKAFEAGKVPPTGQQPPLAKAAEKQAEQPAAQQPSQAGDPFADLSKFKLPEGGEEYDAVKNHNAFVEAAAAELKNLRTLVSGFQQQSQQSALANLQQRATASLHSLGFTDLFGEPGKEPTKEQAANIQKAMDAHFTHARGLLAQGRQPAPTPSFLRSAVQLAFGDALIQQTQKQFDERLKKQSHRISGGSARHAPSRMPTDREARLEFLKHDDPEIDAAWTKALGGAVEE